MIFREIGKVIMALLKGLISPMIKQYEDMPITQVPYDVIKVVGGLLRLNDAQIGAIDSVKTNFADHPIVGLLTVGQLTRMLIDKKETKDAELFNLARCPSCGVVKPLCDFAPKLFERI